MPGSIEGVPTEGKQENWDNSKPWEGEAREACHEFCEGVGGVFNKASERLRKEGDFTK